MTHWRAALAALGALVAVAALPAVAQACTVNTGAPSSVTINYDPFSPNPVDQVINVTRNSTCQNFAFADSAEVANEQFNGSGNFGPITHLQFPATFYYSAGSPCDLSQNAFCGTVDTSASSIPAHGTQVHSLHFTIPAGVSANSIPATVALYLPNYDINGSNGSVMNVGSDEVDVTIHVIPSVSLSFAGGSTTLTMDLGELTLGKQGSVNVMARATSPFRITMTSDMGGVLRLGGDVKSTWTVPYTVTLGGSPIAVGQDYSMTSLGGSAEVDSTLPLQVTIGDPSNKKAGAYRDVLTLQILSI